jgi:radical SAM superfamily enzyme YgiQ (UPF0313 family)
LRYEGPIYRPPSEADSLLVQATVGCPHNKCTFCMVYKKGPRYKVRPLDEICEDIREAGDLYGKKIRSVFFPAGNTIAMPTEDLSAICRFAVRSLPSLRRITVYGSSQYLARKGLAGLKVLREAGLSRIHVGLESGDDVILRKVKKGTMVSDQIEAGRMAKEAGIELSEYVILGLGGKERTEAHALATAEAIDAIEPDFVRLRTLVPKINTLLLHEINKGRFQLLSPREVLQETYLLIKTITCRTALASDHYTNYLDLSGKLPEDKGRLLGEISRALTWDESRFRPHFVGTQ